MAETDWTFLGDELNQAALDRGVTTGFTPPNGGGSFVFGFNSLVTTQGAAGLFTNQAGFTPTAALKGGSIRGAMKRGASSGPLNFAPFLFIQAQGTSVNDHAYMIGLSDDASSRIVVAKRSLVSGLPVSPVVDTLGVFGVGTSGYSADTWLHLRLDAIVNDNGDVLLQAFANDLGSNPVTSPSWVVIPGLSNRVDDQLGVASAAAGVTAGQEQPFTSGRMGFGFYTKDISRRGVFDHIEAYVQL